MLSLARFMLCVIALPCIYGLSPHDDRHNPLEVISVVSVQHALDPSARLSVNISTLEHSGQWCQVTWSVTNPGFDDWIALYVPADANFSETAPSKFKMASVSPDHIISGTGTVRFRLINYRQDMVFALMRGGFLTPSLLALSSIIRVANPNEPLQPRLALTGDNSEMALTWTTRDSLNPVVRYGTTPGQYTHTAKARSMKYTKDDLCGPPANTVGWVDSGTQHTAVMTGLSPSIRYYYIFGDEAHGFSPESSFLTAPPPSPSSSILVLATADLGQAEPDGSLEASQMLPSLRTTRMMAARAEERTHTLWMHYGDISYARGYSTQWDNYFDQIRPLTSTMPYMVAVGNHERDWPESGDRFDIAYDSAGECGIPYAYRLPMPTPSLDSMYYSFNHGPVHFLQYSTEHDFSPGSPQYAFITQDLRKVDRQVTPWVVVGGHRPWYVSSTNGEGRMSDQVVGRELREALEGVFVDAQVDLTFHGHHHSYQRTCPIIDGVCQGYRSDGSAKAPVHLVIGHAGAELCMNVQIPPPVWIEKLHLWWGYTELAANNTHLSVTAFSNEDGSVVDELVLVRPKTRGLFGRRQKHDEHVMVV